MTARSRGNSRVLQVTCSTCSTTVLSLGVDRITIGDFDVMRGDEFCVYRNCETDVEQAVFYGMGEVAADCRRVVFSTEVSCWLCPTDAQEEARNVVGEVAAGWS